ncbi:MAG: peroxiredoxin family protein [Candidatus Binatia bacterium]
MAIPEIGTVAPSFRLPSGHGDPVGLEDYRGRNSVIVWFTKGMACPFCRAQMTRVARVHPEIRARDAEVLQLTISNPRQAQTYASKFKIPFPYLSDSEYRVRREWGIEVRSHGPLYYANAMVAGMRAPKPANDFGDFAPPMAEMPRMLADDDMGFFVVDKGGIVQFSLAGSYIEPGVGDRPLPSNDEILAELDRCR